VAKITKLPGQAIINGFKGTIDYYIYMGQPCVRSWPRAPTGERSKAVQAQWPAFTYVNKAYGYLSPAIIEIYRLNVSCTRHTAKDLCVRNFLDTTHTRITGL